MVSGANIRSSSQFGARAMSLLLLTNQSETELFEVGTTESSLFAKRAQEKLNPNNLNSKKKKKNPVSSKVIGEGSLGRHRVQSIKGELKQFPSFTPQHRVHRAS